jgi:hypothetical protein
VLDRPGTPIRGLKSATLTADERDMAWGVNAAERLHLTRLLPLVGLALLALAFSWNHWAASPQWTPDGLFYEAQARELTGTSAPDARRQVFFGSIATAASDTSGRLEGSAWVEYAAPFYRRRWVVPALGAALHPVVGNRALETVSLLGYVLSGLLVYGLARRRFSVGLAFAAGAFALWFPPLREWAGHPLTDTMGVATMALAFTAASWALYGRRSRLLLWAASVLLLSFTRDTAVIAVMAAICLAIARRSRRTAALACTAIVTATPALLLFGAPLRQTMAFTFSDNKIPIDTSWHYIFHQYGTFLRLMIDFDFPLRSSVAVSSVLLAAVALLAFRPAASSMLYRFRQATLALLVSFLGVAALFIAPLQLARWPDPVPFGILLIVALLPLFLPADGDQFIALIRGGALGAVGYLFLLPQSTELRLPLVVLPFAAIGVARAVSLARSSGAQIVVPRPTGRPVVFAPARLPD